MITDTPQGQTNHCPMCEDAAKKILELEQRVKVLAGFVLELAEAVDNAHDDIGGSRPQLDILRDAVAVAQQTPQQTAAQIERGQCDHDWVCADNSHVKGASVCMKCKAIIATSKIQVLHNDSPETYLDQATRLNG